MECQLAQQKILAAEDSRVLAEDAALKEHLQGCPACQALVARVESLDRAALSLPEVPASKPSDEFLDRVANLSVVLPPTPKPTATRFNARWIKHAVAAGLILVIGLTALTLCLFNGSTAKADTVFRDLVDWNLKIADSHDSAARKEIYREHVDQMTQQVGKASLSESEQKVADALLQSSQDMSQENDPSEDARILQGVAAQVAQLRERTTNSSRREIFDKLSQSIKDHLPAVNSANTSPNSVQRGQPVAVPEQQKSAAIPIPATDRNMTADNTQKSAWFSTRESTIVSSVSGPVIGSPALSRNPAADPSGSVAAPKSGGTAHDGLAGVTLDLPPVTNSTASAGSRRAVLPAIDGTDSKPDGSDTTMAKAPIDPHAFGTRSMPSVPGPVFRPMTTFTAPSDVFEMQAVRFVGGMDFRSIAREGSGSDAMMVTISQAAAGAAGAFASQASDNPPVTLSMAGAGGFIAELLHEPPPLQAMPHGRPENVFEQGSAIVAVLSVQPDGLPDEPGADPTFVTEGLVSVQGVVSDPAFDCLPMGAHVMQRIFVEDPGALGLAFGNGAAVALPEPTAGILLLSGISILLFRRSRRVHY